MVDRKRGGSRIRPQAASDVFPRVVAALEELFTATAEEVSRSRNWGREGHPRGRESGVVFSGLFVQ
jgi:hypothetical protein